MLLALVLAFSICLLVATIINEALHRTNGILFWQMVFFRQLVVRGCYDFARLVWPFSGPIRQQRDGSIMRSTWQRWYIIWALVYDHFHSGIQRLRCIFGNGTIHIYEGIYYVVRV